MTVGLMIGMRPAIVSVGLVTAAAVLGSSSRPGTEARSLPDRQIRSGPSARAGLSWLSESVDSAAVCDREQLVKKAAPAVRAAHHLSVKRNLIWIFSALAVALAGCGGGSSSSHKLPAAKSAKRKVLSERQRPQIQALDSTSLQLGPRAYWLGKPRGQERLLRYVNAPKNQISLVYTELPKTRRPVKPPKGFIPHELRVVTEARSAEAIAKLMKGLRPTTKRTVATPIGKAMVDVGGETAFIARSDKKRLVTVSVARKSDLASALRRLAPAPAK